MRQISFTLNENEYDSFMNLLKSFKSVKNVQSELIDELDIKLSEAHHQIVDDRILNYESGETKSFTWNEVRENARKAYTKK
jgi:uncharacterized protein YlbG (UPF0298 family)